MTTYHCSLSQIDPSGIATKRKHLGWLLAKLRQLEDAKFIPQPYDSVGEFFDEAKLSVSKKSNWRLTKVRVGEFLGCPRSRGLLMATNGILAFTLLGDGSTFLGHLQNFIEDQIEVDDDSQQKQTTPKVKQPRKNSVVEDLRELVE